MIPSAVFSGVLWSILFVSQRMKIYLMDLMLEQIRFCVLHEICWILSPEIPKFNVLWLEKYFLPNIRVSTDVGYDRITN